MAGSAEGTRPRSGTKPKGGDKEPECRTRIPRSSQEASSGGGARVKDPEPEMTSTRRVADGAQSGGGGDRVAGGRARSEEVSRSLGVG